METIHDKNLRNVKDYLRVSKEKQPTKYFMGAHLQYFTKEELIKILDIFYTEYLIPLNKIKVANMTREEYKQFGSERSKHRDG